MTHSTIRQYCLAGIVVIGLLLAFLILAAPTESTRDANYARAQLTCSHVAAAIEDYTQHAANPRHEPPSELIDLVRPPFGGSSLLGKGEADLLDPWGKPCQMERKKTPEGMDYVLVSTTAPDGTPISQFGIGGNAQPKF